MLDADRMAREAGSLLAVNMVIVGAASRYLPISRDAIVAAIEKLFGSRGEQILRTNLTAFRSGREAVSAG